MVNLAIFKITCSNDINAIGFISFSIHYLVLYEMLHFVTELVQWMGRNVNAVDFFLPLQYQQRIGLGNIRDRGFFQNGIAGFSEKGSLAAAGIVLEILAVAADFFQIRLSVFFEIMDKQRTLFLHGMDVTENSRRSTLLLQKFPVTSPQS